MKHSLLLGYFSGLFASGMVVTAQDQNSLHKDFEIEEIASELGVDKIGTVGSLLDLSKENAMQINTEKALSWEELIDACLLSESKIVYIEGRGSMGLSLERYQVSESYDVILYEKVARPLGTGYAMPVLVFFVPHRHKPYGGAFFSNPTSDWEKIEFTASPPP